MSAAAASFVVLTFLAAFAAAVAPSALVGADDLVSYANNTPPPPPPPSAPFAFDHKLAEEIFVGACGPVGLLLLVFGIPRRICFDGLWYTKEENRRKSQPKAKHN